MFKRKKRLKVYSITSVLSIILLFTFLNISWKTAKDPILGISKDEITQLDSTGTILHKDILFSNYVTDIYEKAGLKEANLALPVFEKALIGFLNLKNSHALNEDKQILTVIDFNQASTSKRMWIVDLQNKELLLNTYVAHGQGSGYDLATEFSNQAESHKSSLGFFITNETYFGKHGLSLKLDGQDKGINDLARERAIVVHGADYVSENFIKQTGRLGRSFGCPAVPPELNEKVINLIKDKTCLFINGKSENYQSALLDQKKMLATITNFPTS
ncbi:murein L,D-transpeptidase catalytic domain family protein [Pedobacter sp. SD-b]|uniref:Murein L,D-transpeptidase catalytic domain family protein n=1 Tax=Pedobacter segetis TaxID=2793069 RepID=A0ABS1BII7_9SPHI|nr:murein L,D-transpeptidase catalytic domain family protein [Pedobacter segetis]MBK0382665.1 murein L,D-transpeptidase catalytic domain family protein [Pedobacter segetis]